MDSNQIKKLFLDQGFLDCSQTSLKAPISLNVYKAQINTGNTGSMEFLKSHLELKQTPDKKFQTAFVGLYPYYPAEDELKSHLRVSVYAKRTDYHITLKEKLNLIIEDLKKAYPNEEFEHAVDSQPVLERDLAFKAGLGWVGKNTCIINKEYGSLFFIAEVLTSLSIQSENSALSTDHCGTCTRCIDACPTKALSPHKLEVDKCISYRSIEKKDISKDVLNESLDSWFFGCDICQTVCPWNEKSHSKEKMRELEKWYVTENAVKELSEILTSSNKSLDKKYKDFPLSRARGRRLKRNALQVIHENKISSLKPLLSSLDLKDLNELKNEVIEKL